MEINIPNCGDCRVHLIMGEGNIIDSSRMVGGKTQKEVLEEFYKIYHALDHALDESQG
jgi:hypothetical protein